MKKSLVRTWEGNGADEFHKAQKEALNLLTRSNNSVDTNDVFDETYMFRYINVEFNTENNTRNISWNNETGTQAEFMEFYYNYLSMFKCNKIKSFHIYVELVKIS